MGKKPPMERYCDAHAQREAAKGSDSVAARIRRRIVLETVTALPLGPGPWRILDAGGGSGQIAVELARAGHDVCLVDISAGMLELASRRIAEAQPAGRLELVKADVCDLSALEDGRFDLVIATGCVLSYCAEPGRALSDFRRLTRPGGMLLAEAESRFGGIQGGRRGRTFEEIYRTFCQGQATMPDFPDVLIRLYEPGELRLLLAEAGWRLVHQWPGSVCWALLGPEMLQQVGRRPEGFEQLLALEGRLRKVPELLAAGADLQVLAAR